MQSRVTCWSLTYELYGSVQPGQDLLTEAVVDRHTEEVWVGDEVWFGTGAAGVEHIHDLVLQHELLREQTSADRLKTTNAASGEKRRRGN